MTSRPGKVDLKAIVLVFSLEFLLIYWGLEYTNASRAVIFLSRIRASSVLLYQLVVSAALLPLGAVLLGQTEIRHATALVMVCIGITIVNRGPKKVPVSTIDSPLS